MFNIEAERVTTFSCAEPVAYDPSKPSFVRNCIRSFQRNIAPTLPRCDKKASAEIEMIRPIIVSTAEGETRTITIRKAILCALEGGLYTGIYYAFLMTHPLHGKKTSANIGYSTNPALEVYRHNHLLTNDRTTSAAAPHWNVDVVVGPFITWEKSKLCTEDWVIDSRGIESKRNRAVLMSRIYGVPLYSAHIKPDVPLEKYLTENAPPIYIESYNKMKSGGKKKSIVMK